MKRYVSLPLMFIIATWVVAPGWAQAGSGFYLSGDLGFNLSKGVKFDGGSNDTYSECDQYLNTDYASDDSACGGSRGEIPDNFITDWYSDFDGGQGILAGAAVGYSFAGQNSPLGGVRVELEYFYRESKYDQSASGANGGVTCKPGSTTCAKMRAREFDEGPTERLGSITSHNLFGNVFYDFANTSRFTPYIGIGGGIGFTDADYSAHWTRTADKTKLVQGLTDLRNAAMDDYQKYTSQEHMDMEKADKAKANRDIYEHLMTDDPYLNNLRNAASIAQTSLSDTLWGLQVLFGVDYAVTEAMSLGLKGRWVRFNSFSGDIFWNPLRGHVPYVRHDANGNPSGPMIRGAMNTSDIEFFGISLNMKYHF